MNILTLSDIHFEFGWPNSASFVSTLDPDNVDVVILAGDICTYSQIMDVLTLICKRFSGSHVLWVHGNHEYYGRTRDELIARSQEAMRQNKNLTWLNNNVATIGDQRFLGSTLWFPNSPSNVFYKSYIYDFKIIPELQNWVYDESLYAKNFLERELNEGDVVITHHLPSKRSVSPRFANDQLNRFFLHDVEDLIVKKKPKLWIHGHTHDSFDYTINESQTRVICNPRGYYPDDLNPEFNKDMIVKI